MRQSLGIDGLGYSPNFSPHIASKIESFIETEIIEKLIEEIPHGGCPCEYGPGYSPDVWKYQIEQLRAKWLGK